MELIQVLAWDRVKAVNWIPNPHSLDYWISSGIHIKNRNFNGLYLSKLCRSKTSMLGLIVS